MASTLAPIPAHPAARHAGGPSGRHRTSAVFPCGPSRAAAPLWVRLFAVPLAYALASTVSVLPTLALIEFGDAVLAMDRMGMSGMRMLLLAPVLGLFTAVFAGPFALPVLLWLAVTDRRGVGLQVALGCAATIPAMAAFHTIAMPLQGAMIGAILGGGAIGGLAASAARDGIEEGWQRGWGDAAR